MHAPTTLFGLLSASNSVWPSAPARIGRGFPMPASSRAHSHEDSREPSGRGTLLTGHSCRYPREVAMVQRLPHPVYALDVPDVALRVTYQVQPGRHADGVRLPVRPVFAYQHVGHPQGVDGEASIATTRFFPGPQTLPAGSSGNVAVTVSGSTHTFRIAANDPSIWAISGRIGGAFISVVAHGSLALGHATDLISIADEETLSTYLDRFG
jgi:hypothetical protein